MKVIDGYSPDIISGPVFPYYDTKKPHWFKDKYEIRQYALESGFSTTCRVSGGHFTIRKDVLLKLGKFDVNFGMCGNKIELGEERALLEKYRQITPHERQAVYYSVEGFVNHYVSPFKMRRRYMLKRSYKSGRAIVRIKGQRQGVHDDVSTFANARQQQNQGIIVSRYVPAR